MLYFYIFIFPLLDSHYLVQLFLEGTVFHALCLGSIKSYFTIVSRQNIQWFCIYTHLFISSIFNNFNKVCVFLFYSYPMFIIVFLLLYFLVLIIYLMTCQTQHLSKESYSTICCSFVANWFVILNNN